MSTFNIHIEADIELSEEEVWPDHDGPENPTAEDVAAVVREHSRGGKTYFLNDWNLGEYLGLDVDQVQVWP